MAHVLKVTNKSNEQLIYIMLFVCFPVNLSRMSIRFLRNCNLCDCHHYGQKTKWTIHHARERRILLTPLLINDEKELEEISSSQIKFSRMVNLSLRK